MAWFKLDDQFHSQPKVIAAGNAAIGLYCRLGTYCADKLTDGFVATAIARSMGTTRELRALLECPIPDTRPLLTAVDGGYLIRDYLEFNPTREKVLADRDAAKKRMNKLRGSPDVQANKGANVQPNTGRSSRSPIPDPLSTSSYTQTDDLQHPDGESSSIDLAIKVAARAVYLKNPAAVNGGNPQRYIDGTADKMRTERWHDFAAQLATDANPIQAAAAIIGSRDHAMQAASDLGLPIPEPRPPCPTCDDYRVITVNEDTHELGPCPTCTPQGATR